MKYALVLFGLLSFSSAHAFGINALTSCEEKPVGANCGSGSAYGQTLGYQPVKASLNYTITKLSDGQYGDTRILVHFTLTRLEDPTNLFAADGSLGLNVHAQICGFHRSCNMSTQSTSLTINRTYGQRLFENGTFDVTLEGNGGGEYTQMLQEIDLILPGQAYPIVITN